MLLVDDDEAEPSHRREDRRACANHDPGRARSDALALVAALRLRQSRVQHGDPIVEASTKAADCLWSESDLRHEHDHVAIALERRRGRLEVHLGLSASGRAVQKHVASAGIERGHDPRDRVSLRRRQLLGLRLAAEGVANRRLANRPTSCASVRRDERQRASGCRAVVIGEPERKLDQRRRDAVDDGPRVGDLDAARRLHAGRDHDPANMSAAELDRRHVARSDVARDAVGERACERPRGDERVDLGERHAGERIRVPGDPSSPFQDGTKRCKVSLTWTVR